jgi:hypothetical protein
LEIFLEKTWVALDAQPKPQDKLHELVWGLLRPKPETRLDALSALQALDALGAKKPFKTRNWNP